jgi:hypothetical protein
MRLPVLFSLRRKEQELERSAMLMIEPSFEPAFAALGLDSFAAISEFFLGREQASRPKVVVRQVTLPWPAHDAVSVFYKQYEPVGAKWEFVGRRSKARCEFENYAVFKQLGLPAPERIAVGEERDVLGRLLGTFIITRAIPDALTLTEFVQKHCPHRLTSESRFLRAILCRQLAELTRRMHAACFFHRDLVWRNVLVTGRPPAPPKIWWIDCPRGSFVRWSFLRSGPRLRDLASLDKSASRWCSAGERIQFVKLYLGKPRLDGEAKQLIRDELNFRKNRWPEDWNED